MTSLKIFLEISLTAVCMICLIWAFRALFAKRVNPMVMMLLWTAVLLRLCVPFTIESPIHTADIIEGPEAVFLAPQENVPMPVNAPSPVISSAEIVELDGHYTDAGMADTPIAESSSAPESTFIGRIGVWLRGVTLWYVLSILWITGALGVLLWTVYRALMFKRKIQEGCGVTDDAILEQIKAYKEDIGIKKTIRVIQCHCVDTPAIFGYRRPYLLLPMDFLKKIKKDTLRHVLFHELCHIRRQDILTGYIWLIAKALHWFNPFVWAAYRLYRDDMELCCDRMVIRHLKDGEAYAYSQTLIDMVRSSKGKRAVTAAASLCENKQKLKERVVRMLNPKKRSGFAVAVSLLLGIMMLIGCFTTACRPKSGDMLTIEPSDEIIYPDEYVAGQDSLYWYSSQYTPYGAMADDGKGYYFMGGFENSFLCYMDKETEETAPVCNRSGAGKDVEGYYFLAGPDNGFIYYMNKARGEATVYNPRESDPDPDIGAYHYHLGYNDVKNLTYYKGKLYCLSSHSHAGDILLEIDFNEIIPKELRTFGRERRLRSIAYHRGYMYYIDEDAFYKENMAETVNLYRISVDDLSSDPELLYSFEGYQPMSGQLLCYGNHIYFSERYFSDRTHTYSVRRLNRYNVKTGSVQTVQDDVAGAYYTVFDGKLAYSTVNGTYICDLDGKNSRRISDWRGTVWPGGEYLLVDNQIQMNQYGQARTICAYDTDGNLAGKVTTELSSYPSAIGVSGDIYILPEFNHDTQALTIYSLSVDGIADGTAVPQVFYQSDWVVFPSIP
mgnify:FL=1